MEDLALPSKTYTALATGAAVLAITKSDSDLAELVNGNQIGVVCDSDPTVIAREIMNMKTNSDGLIAMKNRSRCLAVSEYDTKVIRKKWEELLKAFVV
jgi:glycosyltransferase involved in cell wall biosynthesis